MTKPILQFNAVCVNMQHDNRFSRTLSISIIELYVIDVTTTVLYKLPAKL
jgi:hypothetical protein